MEKWDPWDSGEVEISRSRDLEESGAQEVRSLGSWESRVQERCGHVELEVGVNITPPQIFPKKNVKGRGCNKGV